MFCTRNESFSAGRRAVNRPADGLVLFASFLMLAILFWPLEVAVAEDTPFTLERLKSGNYLVMMRHARAPGTGDPANFRLGDCRTQRNLNDTGREQARRFGARLKAAGLERVAIYSSQWCRCLETARALGLGPVRELPALNSFYRREEDRAGNLAALGTFIERLGTGTDRPVILVTHQVTVTAMSGEWVDSGAAKVFRLDGTGRPKMVGTLAAE